MKNRKLSEEEDISSSYLIPQILFLLLVIFIYFASFLLLYGLGSETEEDPGTILYPPIILAIKQCVALFFNLYVLSWFFKKILPRKYLFFEIPFLTLCTFTFFTLLPFLIFEKLFLMWWPAILLLPLFISIYIVCTTLKAYLKQKKSEE